MSKSNNIPILILGLTHLIVDATCIFVLYFNVLRNNIDSVYAFSFIVLYNILAFGLQAIIGDFFDKYQAPKSCAIIGCILTALSAILGEFFMPAAILAGIGNAFFHVGGGIISLKLAEHKATISGIYVAPGAFGLFLGSVLAKYELILPVIWSILLFLCAMFIYFLKYEVKDIKTDYKPENKFIVMINIFLFAIVIRSFIGLSINLNWKENIILLLFLTMAIAFGKMCGGIIADRFGWMKTTITALLISSPLIAFGINQPLLFIVGMFFFNFTMPITLTAIANMLPQREGFAFGLTTLALLVGALPTFAGIKLGIENSITIFFIVILSAILIYFGLKFYLNEN